MEKINEIIELQNTTVKSHELYKVEKRVLLLNKLREVISKNASEIAECLQRDLGKSQFESYLSEIDSTIHEIDFTLKNLKKWMKPKKVRTALTFFPVKSYIYSEPYGKALIIGPWNYPFLLVMSPLIGAIAAGNTAIIKPSEVSEHTSELINRMISDNFDRRHIAVIEGGIPETTKLLASKFEYIFYTGNGHVGRIIMAAAAKNLTPVTLELGGKSPCLVYTKEIDLAAKRIVWGKFFNAGQTCVAPDYILISKEQKSDFVEACKKWIEIFYSQQPEKSEDYGRIINFQHFKRIQNLMKDQEILFGGETNEERCFISPTLIQGNLDAEVMKEEIFGPILPIVEMSSVEASINFVRDRDKPLACYAFLDREDDKRYVIEQISSGGMVINDTIIHLSNANLPFGGVGESGIGSYHGKFSFDLFSHKKAVMKRSFAFENSLRYPPYKEKLSLVRRIMSFLG